MSNKQKLLGHIIRVGNRDKIDPMLKITFDNDNLKPKTTAFRRVGKPINKWHQENMKEAWSELPTTITNNEAYTESTSQLQKLRKAAIDIIKPFDKTKNEKSFFFAF